MHPGGYEWLKTAKDGVAVTPQDPWEPWPYYSYGRWPLVVKLSDRVQVEWFKPVQPNTAWEGDDKIEVSNEGIIAAARIIPTDGIEPFIAVSMYARWYGPHPTVSGPAGGWIYPDASAHSIISDLTTFINSPVFGGHADRSDRRILAAGDLNMDFDFGQGTHPRCSRANTVFDRMNALGLEYMGPQHPRPARRSHAGAPAR